MNVNPTVTAYPVHQMSQHMPYGYSTPTSSRPPPLQIHPQQSPVQNQFFSGPFPPNAQQQPHHHQPPQQYHQQHQHQHQQQHLPQQQPYHHLQQPSPSYYGNPTNTHFAGNGLMPTSAPNVSPHPYPPASNIQAIGASPAVAPPFQQPQPSPAVTSSQQSQHMAAPAALLGSNHPLSQRPPIQNGGIANHPQMHTPPQAQTLNQPQPSPQPPQSPQSIAREKARVAVLLEINSYLLQEVVSLQAQGKAGGPPTSISQQSPIQETGAGSPTPMSATDPSHPLSNSPIDPTKPAGTKPPSQEYIECMRRLQANLAYLAAIADAKKKAAGSIPAAPAIMAPPQHLSDVRDLYKKLNALFPGAAQPTMSKAVPSSGAQSQITG